MKNQNEEDIHTDFREEIRALQNEIFGNWRCHHDGQCMDPKIQEMFNYDYY